MLQESRSSLFYYGRKAIVWIYFILFFCYGGFDLLFPLFLQEKGFSSRESSIILSMLPLSMILFAPLWGVICDRSQRALSIFIGTALATAAVVFFIPWMQSFSTVFLFILLLCILQSPLNFILDEYTQAYAEKRKDNPATLRAGYAVGLAAGGLLTSLLATIWWGSSIIFPLYTLVLFVVIILFLLSQREHSSRKVVSSRQSQEAATSFSWKGLLTPSYLLLLLVVLLVIGPIESYYAYAGLYLKEAGAGLLAIGIFCLASLVEFLLMFYLVDRYKMRWGESFLIILAIFILVVCWTGIALFPSLITLIICQFLQATAKGILVPLLLELVYQQAKEQHKKTSVALREAMGYAGSVVLINLNGWWWMGNLHIIGTVNAVLTLLAVSVYGYYLYLQRRQRVA